MKGSESKTVFYRGLCYGTEKEMVTGGNAKIVIFISFSQLLAFCLVIIALDSCFDNDDHV